MKAKYAIQTTSVIEGRKTVTIGHHANHVSFLKEWLKTQAQCNYGQTSRFSNRNRRLVKYFNGEKNYNQYDIITL